MVALKRDDGCQGSPFGNSLDVSHSPLISPILEGMADIFLG